MTEKERIEKFKSHNLVVNCRTEEEAKKFVKWCYKNGFEWERSHRTETNFEGITTCYRIYSDGHLVSGDIELYEYEGYEIMTYNDFFKEDEMTNLEYIIKNFKESYNDEAICSLSYIFKTGFSCEYNRDCKECEFNKPINVLKYLKEKHIDTIQVTQFEYDLLKAYIENCNISNYNQRLRNYHIVVKMKEQGYFKNLDLDKTIGEIKDKLEVIK